MAPILFTIFLLRTSAGFLIDGKSCKDVKMISREDWGARAAVQPANLSTLTLGMVFVHHTDMSGCSTAPQCALEVRTIQNFHMDERGWDDVGYSFLIGEDGSVFEGRGWTRVGAHTHAYNTIAYSLAILGNFMYRAPKPAALDALRSLLSCGVDLGHLSAEYRLYGHRDTGQGTLCPGDALYTVIQHWRHFDSRGPSISNVVSANYMP